MKGLLDLLRARKSLLLRLLVVVVVAYIIVDLYAIAPQETYLELGLPASHQDAREVRVSVMADEDGALIRQLALRYPRGAPATLREAVDVAPGRYRVEVELRDAQGGSDTLRGRFETPASGTVRVALLRVDDPLEDSMIEASHRGPQR